MYYQNAFKNENIFCGYIYKHNIEHAVGPNTKPTKPIPNLPNLYKICTKCNWVWYLVHLPNLIQNKKVHLPNLAAKKSQTCMPWRRKTQSRQT